MPSLVPPLEVRIPRAYVSPHESGTWFLDRDKVVWLKCPTGHVGRLDDHDISAVGVVSPSVQCPSCDWHVDAVLDDWALA